MVKEAVKIEVRGIRGLADTAHDMESVVGVVSIPNGCCPGKPVIIRKHYAGGDRIHGWNEPDIVYYGAQCSCGKNFSLYTNEFMTIGEAIEAYTSNSRAMMSTETKSEKKWYYDQLKECSLPVLPVLPDTEECEV